MQETAIFGGGCFWCTEALFNRLKGVTSVEPGYAGGTVKNPNYYEVCAGNTGHAEVAKITFDPEIISYKQLLEVFFTMHNPTSLNRQGADVGTQYRSIILYNSDRQKKEAEAMINKLTEEKLFNHPIVTEIKPLDEFYPAEDYHKNYYDRNTSQPYCQIVINPKLQHLKEKYKTLLK